MAKRTPEQEQKEFEEAAKAWRQFKATTLKPFWRWFRRLPGWVQAAAWIGSAALIAAAFNFGGNADSKRAAPRDSDPTMAASRDHSSDTSPSDLSSLRGNCNQDFYVGNIDFVVVLKNDGAKPVDVSITPARHYQDGSTNRSVMDM